MGYEGDMEIDIQKKVTISINQVALSELEFLHKAVKHYNQMLPSESAHIYIEHTLESALEKAKK